MMRRRMAQMNARMNAGMASGPPTNGSVAGTPALPAPPVMQPAGTAGKPGAPPSQNVLEAVKKVRSIHSSAIVDTTLYCMLRPPPLLTVYSLCIL